MPFLYNLQEKDKQKNILIFFTKMIFQTINSKFQNIFDSSEIINLTCGD